MSQLFSPIEIGPITISNRFMRSATTSYHADSDGVIRDPAVELYRELAKGEVGLIVKGHLYVTDDGKAHPGQAGISGDLHISRLRQLTNAVHQHDGTIFAQISHVGLKGKKKAGPSEYSSNDWKARAFTHDEIIDLIDAFARASVRVVESGFDGVQIHGAHGYLISQFLSGHTNKRDDEFGGDISDRITFLKRVYKAIRERVGSFPISLKLNCDDFASGGLTVDDSRYVAKTMKTMGLDLLELSGGGFERDPSLKARAKHSDPELSEVSYAGHAEKIRQVTGDMPLALVEGFTTRVAMEYVLELDIADIISMSRPFIRQPNLVQNIRDGQTEVACTRCNACSSPEVFGKVMLRCQLD